MSLSLAVDANPRHLGVKVWESYLESAVQEHAGPVVVFRRRLPQRCIA